MDTFTLDDRFKKDCIIMGYLDQSVVLLMNNALVPWFILVPMVEAKAGIYDFDKLPREQQILLLDQINLLSHFLRNQFQFDKLNIATIGNIVQQLHIHIVARSKNDYCWPAVVWGTDGQECWSAEKVVEINQQLVKFLPKNYKIFNKSV